MAKVRADGLRAGPTPREALPPFHQNEQTCFEAQKRYCNNPMLWVVVSIIFYFYPEPWGNDPI